MSENTNNLNDNGVIPNFTPAPVFRNSVENKNLLSEKNSMYIGTGETQTVTFGGIEYSIPITKALAPPTEDKSVLKTDSTGEDVLWGPLQVSEIKDDGTPVNVVSVENVQQALGLSLSQLDLLVQLSKLMTVSLADGTVIFNGDIVADGIIQLNDIIVTYVIDNGKATITGLTEKGRAIFADPEQNGVLPSSISGYPVTSIADFAFENEEEIKYMNISSSISSIGKGVFSNCTNLVSIKVESNNLTYSASGNCVIEIATKKLITGCKTSIIPNDNSATSIGDYAFFNCSGLTSIVIPDNVTSIGDSAFSGCSDLTSITIPFVGAEAGKTSSDTYQYPFGYIFGTSSYTGGTAVKQLYYGSSTSSTTSTTYYIPSSLRSVTVTGGNILYNAFYHCSMLMSVTIPDSVTSIGSGAFQGCSGLTSITIPDGVTSIEGYVFYDCSGLTSVTIPDGVTSIESGAFAGCSGLTSITIPDSVTSIGSDAFARCSGLTSITIPDSVASIGSDAFSRCRGLTSTTIPDSVTSIGSYAFYGCPLNSAVFEDVNGWQANKVNDPYNTVQISSDALSSPSTAANYLITTYVRYTWNKI